MTYRILITGTREALTPSMEHKIHLTLTDNMPETHCIVIHGACPTGVDSFVDGLWSDFSDIVTVERYPADWSLGKKAGPLRNKHMVELGADICLAFPKGESRGTRGCAKLAQEAGIHTIITEL